MDIATGELKERDIVIAVMGPTGAGKSNFIDVLNNQRGARSHGGLGSYMTRVQPSLLIGYETEHKGRVVLVDTPGFDDTHKSDIEILGIISQWLERTYKKKLKLTGILYMHPISDNRVGGTPLKNLRMFEAICGNTAMSRVILVTSMWDHVENNVGVRRERDLMENSWKRMLENGSQVARFENNYDSAKRIIDMLIEEEKRETLLLQEELVDLGRNLNETHAGRMLYSTLKRLLEEQRASIEKLMDQIGREDNPDILDGLVKDQEKTAEDLQKTLDGVRQLKVPFNRRALAWTDRKNSSGFSLIPMISPSKKEREWEEEKNRLLGKENEQAICIATLRGMLAKLEHEEKERDTQRQKQAQVERDRLTKLESELEKLVVLERERNKRREEEKIREQAEREKLAGALYRFLPLYLSQSPTTEVLPKCLHDTEAQVVVDFLSDTLNRQDIHHSVARRRVLHLLCKIAKSTRVFPKTIELTGVECDLTQSVNGGGYGVIYKGKYQEEVVCIKAVRMYQSSAKQLQRALRAHAGELVLGAHLSHPNILPIYGAFISGEPTPRICIVSPWMDGGNLVDHLNEHPDSQRILLLSDILAGLRHLHEIAIVHSDLKGCNVLISRLWRAMLADFGVSRIATTKAGATTAADSAGTANWMAPELLTADEPGPPPTTRESDMWAFGCICYEILAGKIPFEAYKRQGQLIGAFISGKAKLSRPEDTPSISHADEIWNLAELCLCYDPNKRPTAEQALKIILDLNVKEERPPVTTEHVRRSLRPAVEIDYEALISIIQQVDQNPGLSSPSAASLDRSTT